jgi:hypothetical protein
VEERQRVGGHDRPHVWHEFFPVVPEETLAEDLRPTDAVHDSSVRGAERRVHCRSARSVPLIGCVGR